MTGTTIGSGMTLTTGYTITTADGNGFGLTNNGVIGATGLGFGLVVQTTGDFVYNAGKILASTSTGDAIFSTHSVRITNRSGGLISASYGIQLSGGGTIVNASGGSINGGDAIEASGSSVYVGNQGVITGTGTSNTQAGVVLNAGGYVYNKPGGSISGANGVLEGVFAKVRNAGTITGNNANGVELNAGGTVTTETQTPNSAATISGSYAGIVINGASGYVLDGSGQISGGTGGVFLQAGGYIHQIGGPGGGPGGGTIAANYAVAINNGSGTVETGGRILGGALGVGMDGAGPHKVTLSSIGATISGTKAISISGGPGYIYDKGTINGGASGTAVILPGGYNNVLEIYSGAKVYGEVFGGNFQGGPHTTTLLLAQGYSNGTLTGFGNRYNNMGNVTVKSGANWTMDGSNTFIDPSFVSAGATTFFPVTLLDAGTLTFGGSEFGRLTLGSNAHLTVSKGGVMTPAYASQAIYAPTGISAPIVVTDGQITAAGNDGIRLDDGGTVTNQADGVISANSAGVRIENAKGTVTNLGQIKATLSAGVALNTGGSVANTLGSVQGTIQGTVGVIIYGGAGTVTNTGAITGTSNYGVKLAVGGTVTNTGGTIKGTLGVGIYGGAGTVTNTGRIAGSGSNDGVELKAGGTVINQAGTIIGLGGILIFGGAGTVTNYGQITGTSIYSVNLSPGFANRLRIAPGASFSGNFVDGGNTAGATAVSTIELLSAASAGTLNGVGSQYKFFSDITVNSGATWTIGSTGSIAAYQTLVDSGTVTNEVFVSSDVTLTNGTFINASGFLSGNDGVVGLTGTNVVVNDSNIRATDIGVTLQTPGRVTNQSDGFIGGRIGVYIDQGPGASVVNQGVIDGYMGVYLPGGGSVDNQSGLISGRLGVVILDGSGTVRNAGTIVSVGDYGVILPDHGVNRLVLVPGSTIAGLVHGGLAGTGTSFSTLELASGSGAGTIGGIGSKYFDFVDLTVDSGAAWTFASGQTIATNQTLTDGGTLTNDAAVMTTILLSSGAMLSNASGATISAATAVQGVGSGGAATVVNDGMIKGSQAVSIGIQLTTGGGRVTNQADGTISAQGGVYLLGASNAVVNYGLIHGPGVAVYLLNGGSVSNHVGGTIEGIPGISVRQGAGTVTNSGVIVGYAGTAVSFGAGFQNRLAISPGAAFIGVVNGGNTSASGTAFSTLELMPGVRAGTLSGFGTQYLNFQDIQVDQYASWTLAAGQVIPASLGLTDDGTLTNDADVLTQVFLGAPGAVLTNAGAGTISASQAVFSAAGLTGPATVVNYGLIDGGTDPFGVGLFSGGSVTNRAGTIKGAIGVSIGDGGAGTVTNASTIIGSSGIAVSLPRGFQNRVAITPGAVFEGGVYGGGGGTLELASGSSAGILHGIGSQYTGFNHVAVDPGAAWTLAAGTLAGATGAYLSDSGTLTNDATVLVQIRVLGPGAGLTNASGGIINANRAVLMFPDGTIVNYGLIEGAASSYGVELLAGGLVTNRAGTITGSKGVVVLSGAGTVKNTSTIIGSSGTAVALTANYQNLVAIGPGAVFTGVVNGGNPIGEGFVSTLELMSGASTGTVTGVGSKYINFADVAVDPDASWTLASGSIPTGATVTDNGTLTNSAIINALVILAGTAAFTNAVAGVIQGGPDAINPVSVYGVLDYGTPGVSGVDTVVNAGLISLHATGALIGAGIYLRRGGSVTNQKNAMITADNAIGATAIKFGVNPGTVTNAGMITVNGLAILGGDGGTVINESGGVISGTFGVDLLAGAGTVTNAGTIAGSDGTAVRFASDYTNRLILDPGATFTGTVDGGNSASGNAVSTLEMAAATVPAYATLSGVGSRYVGFQSFVVDSGAYWNIAAGQQLAATYTVTDNGVLINNATLLSGVTIGAGGFLYNTYAGTISGANVGVLALGSAASMENYGTIKGGSYGVSLIGGNAVITNRAGIISGDMFGVTISGGMGTVYNNGAIVGATTGVVLSDGGTVGSAGSIDGFASDGVLITGGAGTVRNYTEITGGGGTAVSLAPGFRNLVLVNPGAVFHGVVDGGNTIGASHVSTLELASLYGVSGTLSGLDGQYVDFGQITIDAGASWIIDGTPSLVAGVTLNNAGTLTISDGALSDAGSVINNSLIRENAGTMTVATLSGTGLVSIGAGSTLTASGSVAAGQTVDLTGGGLLALVPASFSGQIDGLRGGGTIALSGITDASSAGIVNGNTLAIQQSAGPALDLPLDPTRSYSGAVFLIATIGGVQFVTASGLTGPAVIDQGETVSVTGAGGSTLAAVAGGVGGIIVTDANSLLITSKSAFTVGDAGFGSLAVEAGGSVTAQAGVVIANTASASGSSISLTGAGSNMQVTGTLIVGASGSGALQISGGASVTATTLDVAAGATGDGSVLVAGTGSSLTVTGSLTLGDQAAGELSILGGAQMTIAGGVVGGSGIDGTGNLDIEDAGSTLTINGGTLLVGANGPAEFTLGINGTLDGEVSTEPNGVTNLYGNVDPATLLNDGAENIGNSQGGTSQSDDFYIANSGTITIKGTATFYTPLVTFETAAADGSTTGLWVIAAKDTLVMNAASADASQTFDFTSASGAELVIGQVPSGPNINNLDTMVQNGTTMTTPFLTASPVLGASALGTWAAPIENYQVGDTIVLQGLTYGSASASGDVVTVWSGEPNVSNALGSLVFVDKSGSTTSAASLAEAAAAAAQITPLPCFAAGTRIATADGLVAVERLAVGDRVRTVLGGVGRVVWVGSRAVDCTRHPRPETVWPVRVRARAFGKNVPVRDLYLSPDHAVFVNDVLVPVKLLINGTSITQVKRTAVTYYHVELPEHALILAEGLPVESYLDTGDRANFSNAGTIRLFPDFTAHSKPDAARVWETRGAAPLVMAGAKLTAARQRVTNPPQRGSRWATFGAGTA